MRKQLEGYRAKKEELRELRAAANEERRRAERLGIETDRERAEMEWARYETAADLLATESEKLFIAIQRLEDANERTVLFLRYIKGDSRTAVARRMHYSERQIDKLTAKAIRELEAMQNL